MDMDETKLFVGGISRETSEDALRSHFSKYGTVLGSLVAKDKNTRSPRGFGFVWFSDSSFADKALQETHVILGRTVEVKKAIPKSEQHQYQQQQQYRNDHHQPTDQKNSGFVKNSITGNSNNYFRTKKIFVGGLSASLTEEQFKNYFEKFGRIIDVVVMQDSSTNRPRGFGFVTFDSEESVDKVMLKTFHELNGRLVEVKRAVPKDGIGSNSKNITRGAVRGSSDESSQHGSYPSIGPGYANIPGYVPYHGYSGVWYQYGAGVYGGGYPMAGYGRPGFGVAPVAPIIPWNGNVMIGAGPCPLPYSNTCIYPAYMNGGGGIMGVMVNGYGGIVGPNMNGKWNQPLGGNGQLPPDAAIDGAKMEVDSSDLKGSYDGASS